MNLHLASRIDNMQISRYSPKSSLSKPADLFREMARDLKAGQELAVRLALRDFTAQYRQSYAGYVWAILPPLLASAAFLILRSGNVLNPQGIYIPYAAYLFIGMILWQIFVESLMAPAKVLTASKDMMIKVNFPRAALILSAIYTALIGLAIRMAVLLPVLLYFRIPPSWEVLFFPLGLAAIVLLGSAIGLLVATASLLYTDFGRGLQMITNIWMFLTPVFFAAERGGILGKVMTINPVTHVLLPTRDWLTGVPVHDLTGFFIVTTGSILFLLLGWLVFHLTLPRLIERMGM
ncbi:MAG: ABC transporter permease [Verrucomicrobiota bacterium JB022]|nr:ABC transporter permease [Verrucomicrobiota bacterium JB022]